MAAANKGETNPFFIIIINQTLDVIYIVRDGVDILTDKDIMHICRCLFINTR